LHEGLKIDAGVVRRKIDALLEPSPRYLVDQQEAGRACGRGIAPSGIGLATPPRGDDTTSVARLLVVGVKEVNEPLPVTGSQRLDATDTNG
jgi:hypothetical protein